MSDVYTFERGHLPLLISVPHAGTQVPQAIFRRFTSAAQALPDTDWHVDKLYAFARELGASMIVANYSRYIVDLNRSRDSRPLYTSDPTSPVCPTHTFGGEPIYGTGEEPAADEITERIVEYWEPYHSRLAAELERLRAEHGFALLWDAHSVGSEVPGLFAGVLPEFNFGTRDDRSCPRALAELLLERVTREGKYGAVLNGRFKGGYITHSYGHPARRCYAIQLELARRVYMDERPSTPVLDPSKLESAARTIRGLLECALSRLSVDG
ncbi:MAG: N-formylglutamate deformylase [Xanthomonadaceae bacterium]|nr:N-formylglutamate deformylase [Xanthomonadaceae bacterium]